MLLFNMSIEVVLRQKYELSAPPAFRLRETTPTTMMTMMMSMASSISSVSQGDLNHQHNINRETPLGVESICDVPRDVRRVLRALQLTAHRAAATASRFPTFNDKVFNQSVTWKMPTKQSKNEPVGSSRSMILSFGDGNHDP
jgi:hypothetical protein